jgi:hypothetical protein
MTFADELRNMNACAEAIVWVGHRTLEQAWRECQRSDWMLWYADHVLPPDDPRFRQIAADCAERVWGLVPPEAQLACAWAIGATRRGDPEEMAAALAAADGAAKAAWDAALDTEAPAMAVEVAVEAVTDAAALDAALEARAAAGLNLDSERAAQCDIIRKWIPEAPNSDHAP